MVETNILTLKWGTLKSWSFSSAECQSLLEEWMQIGTASSAIDQNNTPRQKEIICQLIDLCDGDTIHIEWDGVDVSKSEAKKYILNFGSETYY